MRFFCHKPGKLLNFRQCTAPHAPLRLCRREAGEDKERGCYRAIFFATRLPSGVVAVTT